MNAPDLTPGPGVRDAVLRRARVLRLRRQAAWSSAGAALVAVAVVAGSAVMQPSAARRSDVLVPGPSTGATETPAPTATATAGMEPSPTPTPTPNPTPTATASPTAAPPVSLPPSPYPTTPSPTWTGPDDAELGYADEYVDDHGTRRAYPAAYDNCAYRRDPDVASKFPGAQVTASGVRVEGTTVYVTVTISNVGTAALQLSEQTMIPMDALFQGERQMTGTGTYIEDNTLTHMLEPGDSVSAVHRLHAVTCAHSRGPREPVPADAYELVVAAVVYPGGGGEGGPVYAAPVTVTLP